MNKYERRSSLRKISFIPKDQDYLRRYKANREPSIMDSVSIGLRKIFEKKISKFRKYI